MSFFARGRLVFHYVDRGRRGGGVPVLLLHGFPQTSTCWAAVGKRLTARGHRVLALDQRGYSEGARPRCRTAYRVTELVDDVLALLDHQELTEIHLVGHDWGAVVAWATAAWHPARVRTLTALSVPHPAAYASALRSPSQLLASAYTGVFQLPWLPELLISPRSPGGRFRLVRALTATGQTRDNAERDAAALAADGAMSAALNWYRAIPLTPSLRSVPPVNVPTLYVWSDGDSAVTRAAVEGNERCVAGPYRFEVMRGVSHWIPDQAPDRISAMIDEHIRSHAGVRRRTRRASGAVSEDRAGRYSSGGRPRRAIASRRSG